MNKEFDAGVFFEEIQGLEQGLPKAEVQYSFLSVPFDTELTYENSPEYTIFESELKTAELHFDVVPATVDGNVVSFMTMLLKFPGKKSPELKLLWDRLQEFDEKHVSVDKMPVKMWNIVSDKFPGFVAFLQNPIMAVLQPNLDGDVDSIMILFSAEDVDVFGAELEPQSYEENPAEEAANNIKEEKKEINIPENLRNKEGVTADNATKMNINELKEELKNDKKPITEPKVEPRNENLPKRPKFDLISE